MTIRIHTISSEKFKLINKILVAGNYTFNEKEEVENDELTADNFRLMIKNRRPQMLGKALQKL